MWVSFFALVLGASFGWQFPAKTREIVKEVTAVSDRVVRLEKKVVIDPEWETWASRVSGAVSVVELTKVFKDMEASGFGVGEGMKRVVARKWVEIDAEEGLKFFENRKDTWVWKSVIFAEWAGEDFEEALSAMDGMGSVAAKMRKSVLGTLLEGDDYDTTLAYLRKTKSFETAWGVKATEEWLRLMRMRTGEMEEVILEQIEREGKAMEYRTREVLKKLGMVKLEGGADEAVAWAMGLDEDVARYALDGVMEAWAKDDPVATVERLKEWGGLEKQTQAMIYAKNSLSYVIGRSLAEVDYATALEWLDWNGSIYGVGSVMDVLGAKMRAGEISPEAVYDEVAKMKDEYGVVRRKLFEGLWGGFGPEEVRGLLEMIQGKEEGEMKVMAMAGLLKGEVARSPVETAKMVSGMPPGKGRDEVVELVLRNHVVNRLAADFIQGLPGELRGTAVAAFCERVPKADRMWQYGGPEVYPGDLAKGLEEVPDEVSRVKAMRGVGFYWGAVDPVGALEWVRELSGNEKVAAVAEVTRGWAQQSPQGVTDYIEGLEVGEVRDGAISGLVAEARERDLESAWLWTGEIGDAEMRGRERKEVAEKWVEEDRGAVEALIEGVELSATEVEALRAILER